MKIGILGYGKMGKTIERLALERGHEIVYKSSSSHETGNLTEVDVAIDFSTPETAFGNIKNALIHGIPVISGTTGWLDKYDDILNICESSNGCFLYASNFSIGVNLFFTLNEKLAQIMSKWAEYNVDIQEIHHTQKKDAPSGTAITLAEGIIENSEKKSWTMDEPMKNQLAIRAVREGDVKGTHIIKYASEIDSIEIKHEAKSRDGFATGALIAAEWIQGKKGVYSMADVMGLNEEN